jgi:uncharacterized protein YecE (DUF72 family)
VTPAEFTELRRLRRERREARRAKQREQNILRAAKMHAARIAYEREHATPAAPPLRTVPTKTEFHVGCSGWFYWHWRDHIYRDVPRDKWFEKYASTFRTVELNAPFYGWPTVGTVETWRRQVGGRRKFVYAIKVSELITHVKRFVGTKTLVRDFGLIADLLGDRFGCFLFQLPPSVHYSPAMLKRIVTQLDPRRVNVVEFRHRGWWNENVYRAFRDTNTVFCSCSGPRLPDAGEDVDGRRLRALSRHEAVVPARLHERRTRGVDKTHPRQRRVARVRVLQQRPRRLRDPERQGADPPAQAVTVTAGRRPQASLAA